MPRYIDADALIDFLDVGHLRHPSDLCFSEVDVANLLLHAPAISPDEVRGVGEWEHQELAPTNWTFCSVCGRQRSKKYKWYYCPNCGARMTRAEAEKAMEVSEDA